MFNVQKKKFNFKKIIKICPYIKSLGSIYVHKQTVGVIKKTLYLVSETHKTLLFFYFHQHGTLFLLHKCAMWKILAGAEKLINGAYERLEVLDLTDYICFLTGCRCRI